MTSLQTFKKKKLYTPSPVTPYTNTMNAAKPSYTQENALSQYMGKYPQIRTASSFTSYKPVAPRIKSTYGQNAYAQTPAPEAPKQETPKQKSPQEQMMDFYNSLSTGYDPSNAETAARAASDEAVRQQVEGYDTSNKRIAEQIPGVKKQMESYQKYGDRLLKAMDEQTAADIAKEEETTGTNLRINAKTKREMDAKRMADFAQLGTVESGGYYGYTGQQSNADSDFARTQAETRATGQGNTAQIRRESQINKENTRQAILNEISKYSTLITDLSNTYADNETAKNNAIRKAGVDLQVTLEGIRKSYMDKENELQLKVVDYVSKLPDQTKANQMKNELKDTVSKLLSADTNKITGALQGFGPQGNVFRWIAPGTPEALTASLHDKLVGLMSLDNRSLMKGSGAISDFESKLLQQASTALNRNLSNNDYRAILEELNAELGGTSGEQSVPVQMTGQSVTMSDPSGNVFEVDVAEAPEAEANGWRRL